MVKDLIIGKTYKVKSYQQLKEEFKIYRPDLIFDSYYRQKYQKIANQIVTIECISSHHRNFYDINNNRYYPYLSFNYSDIAIYAFEVEEIMEQEIINIF